MQLTNSLQIAEVAQSHDGLLVVVVPDQLSAMQMETEIKFFLKTEQAILTFPDWETLPFDSFSPHQDIISERLLTLWRLPRLDTGILIVPVATLMQRLCPQEYVVQNTFMLQLGEKLDLTATKHNLIQNGYLQTTQVYEHGEFAVRGSIFDIFPMGSQVPYRIELFDDEIETIRKFDPVTQLTVAKVAEIRLLPAREHPVDDAAITRFRTAWREKFSGDPNDANIYQQVSKGIMTAGIEYYLPLFFTHTALLFDYFPANTLIVKISNATASADPFWQEVGQRYEQYRHDTSKPILAPSELFQTTPELFANINKFPQQKLQLSMGKLLPDLSIEVKYEQALRNFIEFQENFRGKCLICVETAGRLEMLRGLLQKIKIVPKLVNSWHEFINNDIKLAVTIVAINQGVIINNVAIISENDLFGNKVEQKRRRHKTATINEDQEIRNLAELNIGDPIVHLEHGIGRYCGLTTLTLDDHPSEFVLLEYAGSDKLYVPVANLNVISRYSGGSPENAPLNKLGTETWQKAKRRAAEQVKDVAAELLDLYARREAQQGTSFKVPELEYKDFANDFPFEETPDQQQAISQVIADLTASRPMDRVVCGDVGFGKTEVAMRAAFVSAFNGKQVVVLVPTTLLAQQHYDTFSSRFAKLPIKVAMLSRFKTAKEQQVIIAALAAGKIDIVVGTHKLLSSTIKFKDLGLVIIDEEHRFGVNHKEKLKALRATVDLLTLTATPIPRTLNMAMASIRDLSIIATAPAKRLAIKTFVRERNDALIQEAILRELHRGGQVFFLHNKIATIDKVAKELSQLVPQASIIVAHGQMPERALEHIMFDFYHAKYQILVCTTIIETGIDIPTANTIIIDRADKFGLAQLHQLRGRVGRSHHQAYAFCLTPDEKLISRDAKKRLAAIEQLDYLGAGFTLATHDLEIRGAGELLGEKQSGSMQAIGFSMYMEMLELAVKMLKQGKTLTADFDLHNDVQIDLQLPCLIPDKYIGDINLRLVLYKRIANAKSADRLDELQVEIIDRFGLLPEQVKQLFSVAKLKLVCKGLGIQQVKAGKGGGRMTFTDAPNINTLKIVELIQAQPNVYKFTGGKGLNFVLELSDPKLRFEFIEDLLRNIA